MSIKYFLVVYVSLNRYSFERFKSNKMKVKINLNKEEKKHKKQRGSSDLSLSFVNEQGHYCLDYNKYKVYSSHDYHMVI